MIPQSTRAGQSPRPPIQGSTDPGGRIYLGITAKYAAGPENKELAPDFPPAVARVSQLTQNVRLALAGGNPVADLSDARRLKESRDRWRYQRGAQGLLRGERVELCQRAVTSGAVGLMLDRSTGCAHFSGVITCGSVWHCPVCADRLTNERRRELQRALVINKKQGGEAYLATFTFPHDLALPLAEGVEKMQEAQKSMKGQRAYKKLLEAVDYIGTIKAVEVTYGENGWHPHVHMLILGRPGMIDELEAIRAAWAGAVEKVGLGKVNQHGFDVRGGDYAAEYVAKFGKEPSDQSRQAVRAWWTAAHELTKGHTKQGQRMHGATPFTLLRWFVEDGDGQAGALFQEYAEVFKGRRQLHYSPGLKAKLDLFELEVPKAEKEPSVKLLRIDTEEWSAILRHNARWQILYTAERYGAEAVTELIQRMINSRGRYSGKFRESDPFSGRLEHGYTDYAARAA